MRIENEMRIENHNRKNRFLQKKFENVKKSRGEERMHYYFKEG